MLDVSAPPAPRLRARSCLRWLLLALPLVHGCPCDPTPPAPPPPPPSEPDACALLDVPSAIRVDACGEQQRLAKLVANECPLVDAGGGQPLNDDPSSALSQWCVYTKPSTLAPGQTWAPDNAMPDCPVFVRAEPDGLWPTWRKRFELAVDLIAPERLTDLPGSVDIVVIDSATAHGRLMTSLARDASGGSATVELRNALTQVNDGRPYGYTSNVAGEIEAALNNWRPRKHERRLIINLSLAWAMPGGLETDLVLDMAQRAACEGALIIVAGGNQSPHECSAPDVAPAAWERLPTPSDRVCRALGIDQVAEAPSGELYQPLVHAISAVNGARAPLFGGGKITGLAAYGQRAVSTDDGTPLGPLTGTSVSSAVASGIAGAVWATRPEWSAAEVMHALWSSGMPTGQTSTLHLGQTPRAQHVATACAAVQAAACPPGTRSCPLVCETPEPLGQLHLVATNAWTPAAPSSELEPTPVTCERCKAPVQLITNGNPPSIVDRIAVPQPNDPPCPPCYVDLTTTGTLSTASTYLQLSSEFAADHATGFMISLYGPNGAASHHWYPVADPLVLDDKELRRYDMNELATIDTSGGPITPTSGWIEIYFKKKGTTTTYSAGNELDISGP